MMSQILNRLFNIIVKRDEKALREELHQPYIQWRTILLLLIVSSIVNYLLNQLLGTPSLDAFAFLQNPLLSVLWSITIFVFIILLSHLIAKVFGSPGKTRNYAYMSAVISSIGTILNSVFLAIPVVGTIIVLALGLYSMYLTYLFGSHVYNMHTRSTLVIVFAPILLFVALFFCYTIFVLASSVSV